MIRIVLALWLVSGFFVAPAIAQDEFASADAAESQAASVTDPLGRDSPRAMAEGLIAAIAAGDKARAAQFLELNARQQEQAESVVDAVSAVLDRSGGLLPSYQLSSDPEGAQSDGLALEEDRFAIVRTHTGIENLIASRTHTEDVGAIWRVAPRSVALIERRARVLGDSLVEQLTPEGLVGRQMFSVPVAHWIAALAIALVAAVVSRLTTTGVMAVLRQLIASLRTDHARHVAEAIRLPLSVLLGLTLFNFAMFSAGLSIVLRTMLAPVLEVTGWVAIGWLVWRTVDASARAGLAAMIRRGQLGAVSVMTLLRRAAKLTILIVALIFVAGSLGIDLTGWLAALGIGGLAFALGAQKTIEHFVGSLSIISDQPVRVGDFCQVDGLLGTVEDIGMRSTRLRTLDRTLITIPNGTMSQARIENYASRDRFRFSPILNLVYSTKPDQMREVLVQLRSLLAGDERISQDDARVRFIGFGASSLDVEIFAYVTADDYAAFLAIKEELNLAIMDVIAGCGSDFAFPSRTVFLHNEKTTDPVGTEPVA